MEVLGAFASALTVVELSYRFYTVITAFVAGAREAQPRLERLRSSAWRFNEQRNIVLKAFYDRDKAQGATAPDEERIWNLIAATLIGWKTTQDKFLKKVETLGAAGQLNNFVLQMNFNKHEAIIRNLQDDIEAYQTDLSLNFQILEM